MAAAKIGAERFLELIDRYGLETVRDASEDLMDYSERMLRREIEQLPDGTYSAEGSSTVSGPSRPRATRPRDRGRRHDRGLGHHVDLTGTSPQVDLPINMPFEGTVDIAVWMTLRSILLDTATHDPVPTNSGLFRPISITAPEGCLANPRFPAPTIARFCGGQHRRGHADAGARAESSRTGSARASATSRSSRTPGLRDGRHWVYMDILEGSYGGRHGKDGLDAVDTLYANTRNNPIEDVESHYPLRITRYELLEDGGGAGRWRGGLGSVREFVFLEPTGYLSRGRRLRLRAARAVRRRRRAPGAP